MTFAAGQYLQFLPGIVVECASGITSFQGSDADHLRLFSHGDDGRGARIRGGEIRVHPGGEVAFR